MITHSRPTAGGPPFEDDGRVHSTSVEDSGGVGARRGGWVAWWYLLLGLALFPAATAQAWSHLRVEGLTPVAVAALVGAVAGLAALVAGGRGVWSRLSGALRIVAVPVLAVMLYGLVLPWCIAVVATVAPRPALDRGAAGRVGLDVVDVSFPTVDGSTLSGWFVPSDNGSTVILLHGSSSTRANVMVEAAALVRAGYGILAYDARGHGESGGRAMEFGWNADRDVSAAIDELIDHHGARSGHIGVYGASLGGEVAIGAAANDARISAVVAEGATGRTAADHRWLADAYGWRGSAQMIVDRVTYGLTDILVPEGPPPSLRDDVASVAAPTLLITAGSAPDEARAARWIRGGSPQTVDVWTVAGATHTNGLETRPDDWTERVVGFLDDALGA